MSCHLSQCIHWGAFQWWTARQQSPVHRRSATFRKLLVSSTLKSRISAFESVAASRLCVLPSPLECAPVNTLGSSGRTLNWDRGNSQREENLAKRAYRQWEYGETKRAGSRRLIRLQNWIIARLKELKEFSSSTSGRGSRGMAESVDLIFITEFEDR